MKDYLLAVAVALASLGGTLAAPSVAELFSPTVKPTWPQKDLICGPFWLANPAFLYCRPAEEVKDIFGLTQVPGAQQAPPRISLQPRDMVATQAH